MTDKAIMGHRFQYGVTAAAAALPVTTRLMLQQCSVKAVDQHHEVEGWRGQLAHRSADVAESLQTVNGQISLTPRPEELRVLLPLCFGGAFAANVLDPALIDESFHFSFDRSVKVFNYSGMKVASGSLTSSAGQPLRLSAQLEGSGLTIANAGTFPSLGISRQAPLMHHHATITVGGTAYLVDNIQINWDNKLKTDRFFNSRTRGELPQGDRVVMVSFDCLYSTTELPLYEIALAGVAMSIVYTNGNLSLTVSLPCVQKPNEDPEPSGLTDELLQKIKLTERLKHGDAIPQEIQFTLDDTP